ncbi:MAG: alpha/beta hydrolase [Actinobacteria bacterium]|nr:alpha/beta hydrolase [Actinomycetota bacterium]
MQRSSGSELAGTPERRRARLDGVPVQWVESGDGFPVVLIHGIPTGPALWRDVIRQLGDVRCLAFEMVGFADSIPAGRGRDISVARQAEYLLAWLDELEIDGAVFVGHDLGGGVAQIAAVRAPERCAGLVLINSIGYDSWPIPSVKALRAVAPGFAKLPAATVYPIMATLFARGHDDLQTARESLDVHWHPYAHHDGAAALARQVRSLDVTDTLAVADELHGLDVPARVVWGAADRFQKVKYGRRFADDLDAELVRIEGGKHFVPEDHPDEVVAAISHVLVEV